jgi:hypothetical protein
MQKRQGVDNGPVGSNSNRRSVDFRVNLGHLLDQLRQEVAAPSSSASS